MEVIWEDPNEAGKIEPLNSQSSLPVEAATHPYLRLTLFGLRKLQWSPLVSAMQDTTDSPPLPLFASRPITSSSLSRLLKVRCEV